MGRRLRGGAGLAGSSRGAEGPRSRGLGLTPQAVVRSRREAAAAAKVRRTNIVPVYATGSCRTLTRRRRPPVTRPAQAQAAQTRSPSSTASGSTADDGCSPVAST